MTLLFGAYPFLAVNTRVSGGLLVVEGWVPDYALAFAARELREQHYGKLYVTGGPLERGSPLSAYKTYAQLGAATLVGFGLKPDEIETVPSPSVRQDRTFVSAVALKHWLADHGAVAKEFQVISLGPHARRTRLLFEDALGPKARVGVTAVRDQNYDPHRWWRTSEGFRIVTGELIAYGYARFLFRPPKEE